MNVKKIRFDNSCPTEDEFQGIDFEVEFLEKLVYEWIRRMIYYSNFRLSNSIIQSMAIQFKLVLRMHWFFPSEDWINTFRSIYNLEGVSTRTMGIGYKENKSVKVRDIVRDLLPTQESSNSLKPEATMEPIETVFVDEEPIETATCDDEVELETEIDIEDELPRSVCTAQGTTTVQKNHPLPPPQIEIQEISYEDIKLDDVEDYIPTSVCYAQNKSIEKKKKAPKFKDNIAVAVKVVGPIQKSTPRIRQLTKRKVQPNQKQALKKLKEVLDCTNGLPSPSTTSISATKLHSTQLSTPTNAKKTTGFSSRRPIKTRDEALKCVKMMEEFAMMKENYRLIGFIERLESLIKDGD